MSLPRITCRICRKPDRKKNFQNIFEEVFTARANDEMYLFDAMQQLAGIEVCCFALIVVLFSFSRALLMLRERSDSTLLGFEYFKL